MSTTITISFNRKLVVGSSSIVAAVLVGWLAVSPYFVAWRLQSAAGNQNAYALSALVDFESVRSSLKAYLYAKALYSSADVLDSAVGAMLVDSLIDRLVTPHGLAALLRNPRRGLNAGRPPDWVIDDISKFVVETRKAYESPNRFIVEAWATDMGDRRVGFVLRRKALSWRVTGLRLPLAPAESALNEPSIYVPTEAERRARAEARAAAWAELEEDHAALNAKRAKLADLQARSGTAFRSLDEEVGADGEALQQKLVNYINTAEWRIGAERSEEQIAALRMKSAEDMYLAQEYVVKGGDYRRAVEILERTLSVDPDNLDVLARLAEYQETRYMTAERFAKVKRGMTEAEVERTLGKVYLDYVRTFTTEGVFAWFYPKDPKRHGSGAAVGVFFRNGDRKVYRTDFNAVEGR
ncbi:MAG: DUF2939 domain-containing protein [Holophagales bacterium]|nr:DUF2939 domain-containing protein [Holophagales bacterium]MYH25591.1 DUF2939 domain-containing protein [Holophagales bacterium]